MRREQQILQAAEKLFHERSFDGVGVDAIGREAGIVGSGVYRHFSSKEEILVALIDQAADALLIQLAEPDPDPRQELQQLVTAHVDFAVNHERLADIWQREHHILEHTDQRGFLRRQRRYIDRWVACLDACYPGHSREELLAAIRALHALMTSDTTRRMGSKAAPRLPELLTALAMSAVGGLADTAGRQAAS
jgi:AcrR family transcriptional regulator